jgi:transketolase
LHFYRDDTRAADSSKNLLVNGNLPVPTGSLGTPNTPSHDSLNPGIHCWTERYERPAESTLSQSHAFVRIVQNISYITVTQPMDGWDTALTSEITERQPAPRISAVAELKRIASNLRRQVVQMVAPLGQGYVQQGLGAADIFTALFFSELRMDVADPAWPDRDRFILSTAHNTAIFYATLAARGCIDVALLKNYTRDGSPLEVNASERVGPLVEATCGSLGQGLSVAVGMALAARRQERSSRVYLVLGDGEMQEGQVWEAALAAGSQRLGNLCVIVDYNRMQVGGHVDEVMDMKPVAEKWAHFGFDTQTIDGNDMGALLLALAHARTNAERPSCIVAETVVGKGAPSLEGVLGHVLQLPPELAERALRELSDGTQ